MERQIVALAHEIDQSEGNGIVGQHDDRIWHHMQPDEICVPEQAEAVGQLIGWTEEGFQEVHGTILVTDACSGAGRCDIGIVGSLTMGQLRSTMVKKNVAPLPGSEVIQMRPPWRSTIFLQIANPMPLPAYSRWVCRR